MRTSAATALLAILVGACSSGAPSVTPTAPPATPEPTAAPSPTLSPPVVFPTQAPGPTDGPEALVRDLGGGGAAARLGPRFAGDPIAAQGVVMCLGPEPVQVYVFGSIRDRMALTDKIDPQDPGNLGTTMITWNGKPRMWQRDRLLILYLGDDAATETLLRNVLGEPFAVGRQGPPPLPDPSCS